MKKNEVYNGIVTRLHFPNKGYVQVEGEEKAVMVKNTLPGQTVSFRCRKAKKKREGLLLEVLKQAENETRRLHAHIFLSVAAARTRRCHTKSRWH